MSEAKIIDGKAVAKRVRERVAQDAAAFKQKFGFAPCLATVLVGDDSASAIYIKRKREACNEVGIVSVGRELPASTTQAELLDLVGSLNSDEKVHGILVQLPLPDHIEQGAVLEKLSPGKDVDGLTIDNAGRLAQGGQGLVPCTPLGVIELLKEAGAEIEGSEAVLVGRSNLVGRPLISLLLAENATVTVCHSRTRDLESVCRRADILVVAAGSPELIGGSGIKPGSFVVDVGMNRTDKGLVGDVCFEEGRKVAGAITPVPGGVGPMTIAMLLDNTLKTAKAQLTKSSHEKEKAFE